MAPSETVVSFPLSYLDALDRSPVCVQTDPSIGGSLNFSEHSLSREHERATFRPLTSKMAENFEKNVITFYLQR